MIATSATVQPEAAPEVSVVIVCMNNPEILYPCLRSIREHTTVSYECLVVAYLFSDENLSRLRADFPWVKIVESREIRGFSENNNLALRKARGRYCFVVNDDTLMKMPVIDRLVADFDRLPDNVAIVSPRLIGLDGHTQVCGVPYKDWRHIILSMAGLWNERRPSPYTNKTGLFRSYNIIGAAFMIRTDIFRQVGWFDEYFFFAPEDLALSTLLNKRGWECWVDADVELIHLEGMSGKSLSMIQTATRPAHAKGGIYFYSGCRTSGVGYNLLRLAYMAHFAMRYLLHSAKGALKPKPNYQHILSVGDRHAVRSLIGSSTPKEIFTRYYTRLKAK